MKDKNQRWQNQPENTSPSEYSQHQNPQKKIHDHRYEPRGSTNLAEDKPREDIYWKGSKKRFNYWPFLATLAALALFGSYLYIHNDNVKARADISEETLNLPRVTGELVGELDETLSGSQAIPSETAVRIFETTTQPRQLVIDRGTRGDLIFELSPDGNYFRFKRVGTDDEWNYFHHEGIRNKLDGIYQPN